MQSPHYLVLNKAPKEYTQTQDPIENHESSNCYHQPIPTAIINIIKY